MKSLIAAVVVVAASSACTKPNEPPPVTAKPATPTTRVSGELTGAQKFSIASGGTELATLTLSADGHGSLELASSSDDAKKLEARWNQIASADVIRVKLHEKRDDELPLVGKEWKRGNANYPEGVRMKLLDLGYSVDTR